MINLLEAFKAEAGFTKKKFGQHFLTNTHILETIADAAEIGQNDNIIEIGPGCGGLTQIIAEKGANVYAVEIDASLVEFLNRYLFFHKNLQIVNQDAAAIDYSKVFNGEKTSFIGNLPYNLSVKIFERAAMRDNITAMVFMFQKEVADRIAALPCEKAYSSLSVFASYMFDIKKIRDIGGGNFWPNAGVTSTVLKFKPKKERPLDKTCENEFFNFVRQAFRQKRKILKNNLQHIENIENILINAGLDSRVRAEELEISKFIELYRIIYDK